MLEMRVRPEIPVYTRVDAYALTDIQVILRFITTGCSTVELPVPHIFISYEGGLGAGLLPPVRVEFLCPGPRPWQWHC